MPGIVRCDPDELDRFASGLAKFLETTQSSVNALQGSFSKLCETWNDQKRKQFEEAFNSLLHNFASFNTQAKEYVPYLHHKAAQLREYLGG